MSTMVLSKNWSHRSSLSKWQSFFSFIWLFHMMASGCIWTVLSLSLFLVCDAFPFYSSNNFKWSQKFMWSNKSKSHSITFHRGFIYLCLEIGKKNYSSIRTNILHHFKTFQLFGKSFWNTEISYRRIHTEQWAK